MLKLFLSMIAKSIWMVLLINFLSFTHFSFAQTSPNLQISEFMANNQNTLQDEDGEYSDWIEIFNAGSSSVNLGSWYLTDDPENLTLWQFPNKSLASGDYLVLFASGKNRKSTDSPFHTNFNLDAEGEYLALVEPNGTTIHHEYAPRFPEQREDISYGLYSLTSRAIDRNSNGTFFVPNDETLGLDWTLPSFNDSLWNEVQNGVGFGSKPGKFTVNVFRARIQISNLSNADRVIENSSFRIDEVTELVDTINFVDNSGGGHFDDNMPFPGQTITDDIDDFVVWATGEIVIPESGTWTFGINSDDGARLRIDGRDVIVDDTTHAPQDALGITTLTAGEHDVELVYFERGGGAELELFAAIGEHAAFDPTAFHLVGDFMNGGIGMEGFGTFIHQDVQTEMLGLNASAYIRLPFSVKDTTKKYALTLTMYYNDGFAAYINGTEVTRRNVPNTLSWDSQAVQNRSDINTTQPESFSFIADSNQLQEEENILAIHGLNAGVDDDDFLIFAELSSTLINENLERYLNEATPGADNSNGVLGFIEQPILSIPHGFYEDPVEIALSTPSPETTIRFTTDGSSPTETNGQVYTEPITLTHTTTLRAAAFRPEYQTSRVNTQTYIFLNDVLQQERPAGYPTAWGSGASADYAMDPNVINDSRYQDTIKDDLKSIPSLSIVMDIEDLFGRRTGIYTHTNNKGIHWERPCSTELILPDGGSGFQINNGIRIQGGYSRTPSHLKHSFRVLFKREYGEAKLRYPLFQDSPVDEFDTLTIRGNYNYTWHASEGGFGSNIGKAEYMRDEFSRRTQLATGQPASHGTYVHLYLNGMYWGLYNICERPDDSFASEHIGGEKEDWDCITGGTRGVSTTQVKAGNKEAWNTMMSLANRGGFGDMQRYEEIQNYVDVENLIDYMLTIYYTGNRDAPTVIGGDGRPWNFYSARYRHPGHGFKFFAWDSEWTLEEPDRNVVTFHNGRDNPAHVFQQLRQNSEFKILLADCIQKHFFNGGAFTPERSIARYREIADFIDRAIVGESARWGDKRFSRARTRDDDWIPERDRILNDYLPVRTQIVIDQLRDAGLFPSISAPEFNQHGGKIEPGFQLTMTSKSKSVITHELIQIEDAWNYEQSGTDLGTEWREINYDDSRWPSGEALFYVESSSLPAEKNTALRLGETTYYFRKAFTVGDELDLNQVILEIRTMIDDGAVIYLNGEEVHRIGMPSSIIRHSVFANRTVSNAAYEGPFEIPAEQLRQGLNVLAVEVHQTNSSSSDVVFGLELKATIPDPTAPDRIPIYYTIDGSDPRLAGGSIAPNAAQYTGPIALSDSTTIRARSLDGEVWSGLNEAAFEVDLPLTDLERLQQHLRITEIMYNPAEGGFEFIEFYNTHPDTPLKLTGVGFVDGIDFTFPVGTELNSGEYLLIVGAEATLSDFRQYYGVDGNTRVLGFYDGKISNDGEQIELIHHPTQTELIVFTYNDGRGWPTAADGSGHSLVPLDSAVESEHSGSLNYGGNWRISRGINGTPGTVDHEPIRDIVINEFAANTSYDSSDKPEHDSNDWIELLNITNSTINLSDWYLSDDSDDLKKWAIPSMELQPGERITFDEISGFHNPITTGFGLSREGEEIYISYLPGIAGTDRVADAVTFKAQEESLTLGRYKDGEALWYAMPPTLNKANQAGISHIYIDEIMYRPKNTESVINLEFIELVNPFDFEVNLGNEYGPWRVDGGIEYIFPEGMILPAKNRLLLVGFDPENTAALDTFKQAYGLQDNLLNMVGPYIGKISNEGERISIEKPLSLDSLGNPDAWGIIDEVYYFHQSPWPVLPSTQESVLQRISASRNGNDPTNWAIDDPTPGKANVNTTIQGWMIY